VKIFSLSNSRVSKKLLKTYPNWSLICYLITTLLLNSVACAVQSSRSNLSSSMRCNLNNKSFESKRSMQK
jgi:hypothetical protein